MLNRGDRKYGVNHNRDMQMEKCQRDRNNQQTWYLNAGPAHWLGGA